MGIVVYLLLVGLDQTVFGVRARVTCAGVAYTRKKTTKIKRRDPVTVMVNTTDAC